MGMVRVLLVDVCHMPCLNVSGMMGEFSWGIGVHHCPLRQSVGEGCFQTDDGMVESHFAA